MAIIHSDDSSHSPTARVGIFHPLRDTLIEEPTILNHVIEH
jgi:hypothetical protein